MPLIKRSLSLGVLRLLSTTEVKEDEVRTLEGQWKGITEALLQCHCA